MIDMNHKYQTRDGRAVRILATDLKAGATRIIGAISMGDKNEIVGIWDASGRAFGCADNLDDLIPVPTKHEAWTILEKRHVVFYSDKSTAQENLGREDPFHPCFLAHVTWED